MKKSRVLCSLIVSCLTCSCSPKTPYINNDKLIQISVEESQFFEVKTDNPLEVEFGDDAVFEIVFLDDYKFVSASNGIYSDGYLTVKNVQYPETIKIECEKMITVYLNTGVDSHFTVSSSNPVVISSGDDAVFDVILEDGYKFETKENVSYSNGQLIFSNLSESQIVNINTILGDMLKVEVINNNSLGTVTISPLKKYYDRGDLVTISTRPINNNLFICYSKDKEIHKQNNSESPFSFKEDITIEIENDITLVTNYHSDNDYLMEYDLNGGTTFENDDKLIFDYTLFGKRIRPNSLMNDGYFIRDGYYLDSYNTKIDGSGKRIGIGSRIDVDLFSEKYIKLYCQWIKETNCSSFEYLKNENKIEIIKYIGDSEIVVLPERIDNMPVETIKSNAFVGSKIKKIYVPNTVKAIETSAFINCNLLEELHYWTALETISDSSFVECNKLCGIYINCSTYPKYLKSSARGNFADKLDNAEEMTKNCKTIIAVGSSTLQYNHDFKSMEASLDNEYACYNLACLFAMPLQLMYDFALYLIGEDDSVLIQLHETQAGRKAPVGVMAFAYLEGDLDRFTIINYQNHKSYLLSSWSMYKSETSTMTPQKSFEYYDTGLKDNGDYIWSSSGEITEDNKGAGTLTISSAYKYEHFSYLANLHDYHNRKTTFLTFDTYNKNAVESMDSFLKFENLIVSNFNSRFTIISSIEESIIDGISFRFQDNIHLNENGGKSHSIFFGEKLKCI